MNSDLYGKVSLPRGVDAPSSCPGCGEVSVVVVGYIVQSFSSDEAQENVSNFKTNI